MPDMTRRAFIIGVSGLALTADEIAFIADARPWGLILFARNIAEPEQVARLVAAFRTVLGDGDAPVLIDQEGGRVQRLRQPYWADYPPANLIGHLFAMDPEAGRRAAYLKARLIGADLAEIGISVDCAPTLDLAVEGAHQIIGERALAAEPGPIITLAEAAMRGFAEAGVLPVVKHMPGHGRGLVDSHLDLPVVATSRAELEETDFAPFRALADAPLGMSAHIIYSAIDPDNTATLSRTVIGDVIRGSIGFKGVLMTDDLGMKALPGSFREKTERAIAAGVDLALHCSGAMPEMIDVALGAPLLEGAAAERCAAALARRRTAETRVDRRGAEAELATLIARIDADAFRPAMTPMSEVVHG